jgi:hypothetical protein
MATGGWGELLTGAETRPLATVVCRPAAVRFAEFFAATDLRELHLVGSLDGYARCAVRCVSRRGRDGEQTQSENQIAKAIHESSPRIAASM